MNILNFFRKHLKGERGDVFIWGLLVIPILLFIVGLAIDSVTVWYVKGRAKDSITYALEAGTKVHEVLADNTIIFERPQAELKVYEYLRKNLDLNNKFSPNSDKGYIDGTVEIKEVLLLDKNSSSFPYICPITKEQFDYPTIHIHVEIPIKLFFLEGMLGLNELKMPVHVDVSTEDFK